MRRYNALDLWCTIVQSRERPCLAPYPLTAVEYDHAIFSCSTCNGCCTTLRLGTCTNLGTIHKLQNVHHMSTDMLFLNRRVIYHYLDRYSQISHNVLLRFRSYKCQYHTNTTSIHLSLYNTLI